MKRPVVLLVNPWIHDFAAFDLWARPMGLLILANRLRSQGWEPILVDCLDAHHPDMGVPKEKPNGTARFPRSPIRKPEALQTIPRQFSRYGVSPEAVRKELGSLPVPSAILVTSLMTYWYTGVRETVGLLREIHPRVPLLLGGIYASLLPDHAREQCRPDEIIVGPGEAQAARALFKATGVAPRDNERRPGLEFSPALDLLRHVRFLPLLTSRGCPYRCAYCASKRLVPSFVRRPVEDVLREIRSARISYGITDIALYDDAFLLNPADHAIPLLEAAASEVPGLRWHTPNGLHASVIDVTVAGAMKRAGFETIRIGLESSSDDFHRGTGRKTDFASFVTAVRNLRDAGFSADRIGAYLLVGLPGQSRGQVEDDIDRVLQIGAYPKLAEYSPIPGTDLWPVALRRSRYPIDRDPLFHNCTLLSAAEPDVDWDFLQEARSRIREFLSAKRG
jgi:radical SAM superfamily enzyme YgiQ (UPF0313 family)